MSNGNLELLIERNKEFKHRHRNNLLYKQMQSGHYSRQDQKDKFLDVFQTWSNCFQKAMLLKTALCEDPIFTPTFLKHYHEEFGHNEMLINDRRKSKAASTSLVKKKDALLEAICNWFPSKMFSLTPQEQIVVMNLTVEACALVFYEYAKTAIDPEDKLKHFQSHGEIDICHENLGLDLLETLSDFQYKRLLEIQEDSWAMLDALMNRVAELMN
jgi:hypothetical protein